MDAYSLLGDNFTNLPEHLRSEGKDLGQGPPHMKMQI